MARILVATVPLTGHVEPMRLVVRELVARGHAVQWTGARKFAAAIAATGAAYAPPRAAPDWDDADIDASLPALRGLRGLARTRAELREMFIAPLGAQLRDLRELPAPDLILADQAHLGAAALAELSGVPHVALGVSALGVPSVDTAPFGTGWRPGRQLRNAAARVIVRALFAPVEGAYRRARARAELPPPATSYFAQLAPDLYLQPTIAAFEYPRRDLPAQVRFIGPLVPPPPPAAALPPWWDDLLAAHARGTPIVLVTQGTLATDPAALIAPALAALADEDVFIVATTPRKLAASPPANARVAPFIPYAALLPRAAVMITNAGYGGVQMALQHGVPLVAAGDSEEKPEIAARIAWSGVGIDLRTGRPRPAAIARATRLLLAAPRYRRRAGELGAQMRQHDAPRAAATLIEALLESRCAREAV